MVPDSPDLAFFVDETSGGPLLLDNHDRPSAPAASSSSSSSTGGGGGGVPPLANSREVSEWVMGDWTCNRLHLGM